ncbi:MAG: hypothetical protein OXG30_16025, partial [bacterium]|nr:hypothetical protein [bacterium]
MAGRRHTPEQVVRKLREADRLLGEGASVGDVARHLGVSEGTFHRCEHPPFGRSPRLGGNHVID